MSTRRGRKVLRTRALRARPHDGNNRTGEDKNIYKRGHAMTFEPGKAQQGIGGQGRDAL